jgi:hypothetical protein
MEKLVEKMNEMNRKTIELKVWLEQKEVIEYNTWKEDNKTDRSAMDKVVAKLKLEDDNWLLQENEYYQAKIELDKLKSIYNIALKLLDRDDYTREDIENFVKDLI